MAYRIETASLDKAEPAPGGGLRIPAAIGRSGILIYRKADGTEWREYRPPEEAFSSRSLASLRGAPVTDMHPSRPVDPETYPSVVRGHVGDDTRQDDDGQHIAATVYVHDARLIRAIAAESRSELSAGYEVDIDETPGTTPEGEHYDAVQKDIIYNHVAVIPPGAGRAGPTVRLRLDSRLDQIIDPADAGGEGQMKRKIVVRGRAFSVDADEVTAEELPKAVEEDEDEIEALKAEIAALKEELAAAKGATDEAKGRADALEEAARKTTSPEAIQALVTARVDLERKALTVKPDIRCDGLSDREVMIQATGFQATTDHSDDYLRARFDAVVEQSGRARTSLSAAHVASLTAGQTLSPAEAARRRMLARHERGEV